MKENFVTLFNSKFMPQGLVLHESLNIRAKDFTLWVICIDELAYELLEKLSLPNLVAIRLAEYETDELLRLKQNRNFREYCWTLTPYVFKFIKSIDSSIPRLTYLDADLWFLEDPTRLLNAFSASGKSALITPHYYSPFYDQSRSSGKFCVQFLSFDFTRKGETIRDYWEKKCAEWCYDKIEEERFGDQKYLDSWPDLFKDEVYIVDNKDLFLAPWNITSFSSENILAYHFHGLRILKRNKFFLGGYLIPMKVYENLYVPYILRLKHSIKVLNKLGFNDFQQAKLSLKMILMIYMPILYYYIHLVKLKNLSKI